MIVNYRNNIFEPPFALSIKFKIDSDRSSYSAKEEFFIELLLDDEIFDNISLRFPNREKIIEKKFLYLDSDSKLKLNLYRKIDSAVVSEAVEILFFRDIPLRANNGIVQRSYHYDDDFKFQLEFDLRSSRFFSVQKDELQKNRNSSKIVVNALNDIMSSSVFKTFSKQFPGSTNIADFIMTGLTEVPGALNIQDVEEILSDIDVLQKQSMHKFDPNSLNLISSENIKKTIIYPYGKYNYPTSIDFINFNNCNNHGSVEVMNNDNIVKRQPVKSSEYDLNFENYLTSDIESKNNLSTIFNSITLITNKIPYSIIFMTLYDYIIVLKQISMIRFLKYSDQSIPVTVIAVYEINSNSKRDIDFGFDYEKECITMRESLSAGMNRSDKRRESTGPDILIPFSMIKEVKIGSSYHTFFDSFLEININSITLPEFNDSQFISSCKLQVDNSDGNHYSLDIDLRSNHQSKSSVDINKSFKFLVSTKRKNNDFKDLQATIQYTIAKKGKNNVKQSRKKKSKKSLLSKLFSSKKSKGERNNQKDEKGAVSVPSDIESENFTIVEIPIANGKEQLVTFKNFNYRYEFQILIVSELLLPKNEKDLKPYFTLYFGDKDGQRILSCFYESSPGQLTSSGMENLDWQWNELIDINRNIYREIISFAKYIIVELRYEKTNECVGEVFIPFSKATEEEDVVFNAALQLSKYMENKDSLKNELKRSYFGKIYFKLKKNKFTPSTISDNEISLNIKTNICDVRVSDCCWPCRILNRAKKDFDPLVLSLYVNSDGIDIKSLNEYNSNVQSRSNFVSILKNCLEQGSEKNLHLTIPYHKISVENLLILSDSMIFMQVYLLMEADRGNNSNQSRDSFHYKGFVLNLIVGPCIASDIYLMIFHRIEVQSMKRNFMDLTLNNFSSDKSKKGKFDLYLNTAWMKIQEVALDMKKYEIQQNQNLIVLRVFLFCKTWLRIYMWLFLDYSHVHKIHDFQKCTDDDIDIFTDEVKSLLISDNISNANGGRFLFDVEDILYKLQKHVRNLLIQNYSKKSSDCLIVSESASTLVFNQYLLIVRHLAMLSESQALNPQFKRDLILFVITHDNLFDERLSFILIENGYIFKGEPLLSQYLDFDKLTENFSSLLDDNIRNWNSRILNQFLKEGSLQNNEIPWEIEKFTDYPTEKEYLVSQIPEQIQAQLNIQIGLKRIFISSENMSETVLNRVNKINKALASAISNSYISFANDLKEVITRLRGGNILTDTNTLADKKSSDDISFFLISVVNDCNRMINKHIRECTASFNCNMTARDSNHIDNIFLNSANAIRSVSWYTLNLLCNELFLSSELVTLFINKWNDYIFSVEGDSQIGIIIADIRQLFQYTKQYLNDEDNVIFFYITFRKLLIRYFILLRDFVSNSSNQGTRGPNINMELFHKIGMELREITTCYYELNDNIIPKNSDWNNVNELLEATESDFNDNNNNTLIVTNTMRNCIILNNNLMALLADTAKKVASKKIVKASEIQNIMADKMKVQAPAYSSNTSKYFESLKTFFASVSIEPPTQINI